MTDNYQRWLDGEISDSELNRLQSQNRLFTLEEVHALELSAVKATEERIIKVLQEQGNLCGYVSPKTNHPLRCPWKIMNGDCDCQNVLGLIRGGSK